MLVWSYGEWVAKFLCSSDINFEYYCLRTCLHGGQFVFETFLCIQVSKSGSVKIERLMNVERYSHVMHISSTVSIPYCNLWMSFLSLHPYPPSVGIIYFSRQRIGIYGYCIWMFDLIWMTFFFWQIVSSDYTSFDKKCANFKKTSILVRFFS